MKINISLSINSLSVGKEINFLIFHLRNIHIFSQLETTEEVWLRQLIEILDTYAIEVSFCFTSTERYQNGGSSHFCQNCYLQNCYSVALKYKFYSDPTIWISYEVYNVGKQQTELQSL